MDYTFDYEYTPADRVGWNIEVGNLFVSVFARGAQYGIGLLMQFALWAVAFSWILQADLSVLPTAMLSFSAILAVSRFHEAVIGKALAQLFARTEETETYQSTVSVNKDGVSIREAGLDMRYGWAGIHGVHDAEQFVMLISDNMHPIIPARCFASVLEKDAFVRTVRAHIDALRDAEPTPGPWG